MGYVLLRSNGLYKFSEDLNSYQFIEINLDENDLLNITKGILPEKVKKYIDENDIFLGQEFNGYKSLKDIDKIRKVLDKIEYRDIDHKILINYLKDAISNSVTKDYLAIQMVLLLDDLNKTLNLLSERFREIYGLYLPEVSREIEDHEKFIKKILNKKRDELMKEFNIEKTMGGKIFSSEDEEMINIIASKIYELYQLRDKIKQYLEDVMLEIAPNVTKITGAYIAAKLLAYAGGLEELAKLPSSTIQVLGAEKALFKHLTKHTPPPKHGFIFNLRYIQDLPKKYRGSMARTLASKIAIAAKVDYYDKGKDISEKILKELEKRFKDLKSGNKDGN